MNSILFNISVGEISLVIVDMKIKKTYNISNKDKFEIIEGMHPQMILLCKSLKKKL